MRKSLRKLAVSLMAVMMAVVMMPMTSFAADDTSDVAFKVQIKNTTSGAQIDTGNVITKSWMEANKIEAQVFPFAGNQGKTWEYVVAEGPTYADVLKEAFNCEDLNEIKDAKLYCNQNFYMSVDDIINGTFSKMFKCVDENGDDIVGAFNSEENKDKTIETKTILGAPAITPIVANKVAHYETYEEACDALDSGDWLAAAKPTSKAYVGGISAEQTLWDKDNQAGPYKGKENYNGKYALNMDDANPMVVTFMESPVKTGGKLKMSEVVVDAPTGADAVLPFDTDEMTDTEVLLATTAVWTSSDETVATVDANGHVTPVKPGTCKVTAETAFTGSVCTAAVTVKKTAMAPFAVENLTVKNVKKKSAQLTWTASENADGYYIYRSKKKSSGFKKIKTIKSKDTTSFKNKKLKKRAYYYKVVAYNTYDGTKLTTKTGPVKVTIKK